MKQLSLHGDGKGDIREGGCLLSRLLSEYGGSRSGMLLSEQTST